MRSSGGIPRRTNDELLALVDPPLGVLFYNTTLDVYQYWADDDWQIIPYSETGVFHPVSEVNELGVVYIKGDGTANGDRRLSIDVDTDFVTVEQRIDGLWQPADFETGPKSFWVGRNVGVAGIGRHLVTEASDGRLHFHAHSEYDGELSVKDAQIVNVYQYTERLVFQPDESGSWTGTVYEFISLSTAHTLVSKGYLKTDTTAASQPVRIEVWKGTDDTGGLIFDQWYPESKFPASSEIVISYIGDLEFETGNTYFTRYSSAADFSMKLNAAGNFPWVAADMGMAREDNLLQTAPWVDGGTYTKGDWFIDQDTRKMHVCSVTGVQTGTFAENSDKWDVLGETYISGSFTEGSIPFAGSDGKLKEDNPRLSWSEAENKLSVGGSLSVNSLEIIGADGEVNKAAVEDSGNWDAAYTHISNDGSDHSFINQDVTSSGTPTFSSVSIQRSDNANPNNVLFQNSGGWYNWRLTNEGGDGTDDFTIAGGDAAIAAADLTPRITIKSDGKVGIGTASPSTKLEVNGSITANGGSSTNWNTAYGWGDHSVVGYLTSETSHADVVVDGDFVSNGLLKRVSNGVYEIVTDSSGNWNTAYSWGDHSLVGYLTSETIHADVVVDGDFVSDGLLKRVSEGVYGIVTDDSADWNTAYTHVSSDGKDHSDVVLNNTHRLDNSQAHSDYLLNNANDSTTGTLTALGFIGSSLQTTSGTLKIQSGAVGDVTLFSSADVGDTDDGKEFRVWRNAPEGSSYLRMYGLANQSMLVHSNETIILQNATGKNIQFNSGQHIYLNLGDTIGSDEVRIRDSAGAVVATIDSNGNAWFDDKVGIGIAPTEDFHIEKPVVGILTSKLYNSDSDGISQYIVGANTGGHINLIANGGPGSHLSIPVGSAGIAVDWGNLFVVSVGDSGSALEMMRLDASAGKTKITGNAEVTGDLGIGTSSPTGKLNVEGSEITQHGNNAGIVIENTASGGDTWYLRTGATGTETPAGGFSIADTTAYRLAIDQDGNVGIGTTGPNEKLHVVGNTIIGSSGSTIVDSENLLVENVGTTKIVIRDSEAAEYTTLQQTAGGGAFFITRFDTGGTEIALQGNGNIILADGSGGFVGINTVSPQLPLDVRNADDNLAIFFDTRAQAQGVGGGIAFGGKYNDAGGEAMAGRIGTKKTNSTSGDVGFDMIFETQDSGGNITPRIYCTSDGLVAIGDIAPTVALDVDGAARIRGEFYVDDDVEVSGNIGAGKTSPTFRLDAYINRTTGIVRSARFQVDGNHVNARGLYVIAGEDTESGTNYWFEAYDGDGGTNTGGLRSVAGVFDVYDASDKRLKKEIRKTKIVGKDTILGLKVRDFEWKKSPGHRVTGLIAQEVLKVCPDAVGQADPSTGMYAVSRSVLIPHLIKHNQEQQVEIDALKARVARLEVN